MADDTNGLMFEDYIHSQEGTEVFRKLSERFNIIKPRSSSEISRQAVYMAKKRYINGTLIHSEAIKPYLQACYGEWLNYKIKVNGVLTE